MDTSKKDEAEIIHIMTFHLEHISDCHTALKGTDIYRQKFKNLINRTHKEMESMLMDIYKQVGDKGDKATKQLIHALQGHSWLYNMMEDLNIGQKVRAMDYIRKDILGFEDIEEFDKDQFKIVDPDNEGGRSLETVEISIKALEAYRDKEHQFVQALAIGVLKSPDSYELQGATVDEKKGMAFFVFKHKML